MTRHTDESPDVLAKLHGQIAKDKDNDSTETGSFPVIRRKPKRVSLNAKSTRARLYSSVLVTMLCALLGFGYVIQLNNTNSTYETMSEDELTRLISETSSQVQKLEQRKSELTSQLNSLKDTADKNAKAAEIAKPAVCQPPAKESSSVSPKGKSKISMRPYCSPCLKSCATVVPKSLKSTMCV